MNKITQKLRPNDLKECVMPKFPTHQILFKTQLLKSRKCRPKNKESLKIPQFAKFQTYFSIYVQKTLTLAALGGRNTGNLNAILYILSTRNKLVSERGITKTDLISLNQVLINFTQLMKIKISVEGDSNNHSDNFYLEVNL